MRALVILGILIAPVASSCPAVAARPAATRAAAPAATTPASGAITLAERPGTPLDATARQLVARDLSESRSSGDTPLLLTGAASLGSASDRPALFVQLQSSRECGSAGCSTTVYLWQKSAWKRVLDGVGGRIVVGPSKTRGMADLVTDNVRYVWTGTEYRDSRPAPAAVDLRRRK
jgi:hypothetical protein